MQLQPVLVRLQQRVSAGTAADGSVRANTANTANVPVDHTFGYLGALLVGAFMPLYVAYGFDTAGSLAEETSDPRRKAPRAIVQALLTAAVMGFLLILFGAMAVSDAAYKDSGVEWLGKISAHWQAKVRLGRCREC